jgi:hypothetical protein
VLYEFDSHRFSRLDPRGTHNTLRRILYDAWRHGGPSTGLLRRSTTHIARIEIKQSEAKCPLRVLDAFSKHKRININIKNRF